MLKINTFWRGCRTVEILDDMQAESDGIAEAVSTLKNLLGGIEI